MDFLSPYPKMGSSYLEILRDPLTLRLLGWDGSALDDGESTQGAGAAEELLPSEFMSSVSTNLTFLLRNPAMHLSFLKIGYSALEAFLQSVCTGPPLEFRSEEAIIPPRYRARPGQLEQLKKELVASLAVDGVAVYPLIPDVELFWLAKLIMTNPTLATQGFNGRRARFRVTFIHQKLLLEKSDALREATYADADILGRQLQVRLKFKSAAAEERYVEFLLERAALCTYYGDDAVARENLAKATRMRNFQFAITGRLGKRTKFQQEDLSQLVVLARSRSVEPEPYSSRRPGGAESRKTGAGEQGGLHHYQFSGHGDGLAHGQPGPLSGPENIPLNNDTLLESISFQQVPTSESELTHFTDKEALSPTLAGLDPGDQPLLNPMDSIILLATASAITNTSPADGLTREETIPYATRVLEGGSSNWQVYSQALLVRSRIEGYRSRTAERGLLQLQALADQVIAETTREDVAETDLDAAMGQGSKEKESAPTTFLPKLPVSEAASPAERLQFIYQLSPPLRWELEAELAARWVQVGGLKTALEIYERLQMFAEVALCLAGTDREAEAIQTVRKLLFEPEETTSTDGATDEDGERKYMGPEKTELPTEAPRLFCILGDLEDEPKHYERAWVASKNRYGRAQRSLGRYYAKRGKYAEATEAYRLSLQTGRLNTQTWFALGSAQLEMEDWPGAVESFTRTVQLEGGDAEAWSNLAAALLRLPVKDVSVEEEADDLAGDGLLRAEDGTGKPEEVQSAKPDAYKTTRDALSALRRASQLKREDARIWDNYLTVAASLPPPWTPWGEIVTAQKRVIELRGKKMGERAVDEKILAVVVAYVTSEFEYPKTDDDAAAAVEAEPPIREKAAEPEPAKGEAQEAAGKDDIQATLAKEDPEPEPPAATAVATLRPGSLPRELIDLMDNFVAPAITTSAELWRQVAELARWRGRPLAALDAHEKSWRAATAKLGTHGVDAGDDEACWTEAATATEVLVRVYEELGDLQRERTGGKVVARGDWRAKARTAVRAVLGRGRDLWEGTEAYGRLEGLMARLTS